MSIKPRQPRGVPIGGQYAGNPRPPSTAVLDATAGSPQGPHLIVIERQYGPDLRIAYPSQAAAQEALEGSLYIDGLCEEDCLDAYTTPLTPGTHATPAPLQDQASRYARAVWVVTGGDAREWDNYRCAQDRERLESVTGQALWAETTTPADLDGTDDSADWLSKGHVLDASEVAYLRGLRLPAADGWPPFTPASTPHGMQQQAARIARAAWVGMQENQVQAARAWEDMGGSEPAQERAELEVSVGDLLRHELPARTVADLDGTVDCPDWLSEGHVLDASEVAYLRGLGLPT